MKTMRYYLVIDQNLSTYYLSGESLIQALDKGNLSKEEIERYYEVGVEDYIHKPIGTPDNIDRTLLSPKTNPDLCPLCEIGTVHRVSYDNWLQEHARYITDSRQDYEYCDYCDYISLPEPEENRPTYYDEPTYLEYLPY